MEQQLDQLSLTCHPSTHHHLAECRVTLVFSDTTITTLLAEQKQVSLTNKVSLHNVYSTRLIPPPPIIQLLHLFDTTRNWITGRPILDSCCNITELPIRPPQRRHRWIRIAYRLTTMLYSGCRGLHYMGLHHVNITFTFPLTDAVVFAPLNVF